MNIFWRVTTDNTANCVPIFTLITLNKFIKQVFHFNTVKMSTEDFQIITRGRGKVLLSSGYQFYQQRVYKNGKSKWRCKRYKDTKCAGSVTLAAVRICLFLVSITNYIFAYSAIVILLLSNCCLQLILVCPLPLYWSLKNSKVDKVVSYVKQVVNQI